MGEEDTTWKGYVVDFEGGKSRATVQRIQKLLRHEPIAQEVCKKKKKSKVEKKIILKTP